MKNNKYNTVSCEKHSELELLIMYGKTIQIELEKRTLTITPYDIVSRKDSGEFLLGKTRQGELIELRLDQIKSYNIIGSSR